MVHAEHRIIKALPKLAKAATCVQLRGALLAHLKETEGQVKKLEQVFKSFGEKPRGRKCEATVGLLKEGDEIAAENKGQPTLNAALVSAGQKVEHYEIASYGCLREWAVMLGNSEAANLILQILEQEKAADQKLGELAASHINREALAAEPSEDAPAANGHKSGRRVVGLRTASRKGMDSLK